MAKVTKQTQQRITLRLAGRNKDISESHKPALAASNGADRGWTGVCSDLLQAKLSGWIFLPSRDLWCISRAGCFTGE